MMIAWKNKALFPIGKFQAATSLHINTDCKSVLEKVDSNSGVASNWVKIPLEKSSPSATVNQRLSIQKFDRQGFSGRFSVAEKCNEDQKEAQHNNGLFKLRLLKIQRTPNKPKGIKIT